MILGLCAAAIVLLFLLTSPKKNAKAAPDPVPAPFPGWPVIQQMQAPQPAPPPQPAYRTNREAELAEDADLVRSYFLDAAIAEQRAAAIAKMAAYMPAASLPTLKPKNPAPVQAP